MESWQVVLIGGLVVALVVWMARKGGKPKTNESSHEWLELIRKNHGTLSLGDLMMRSKRPKSETEALLLKIASDYGGVARLTDSGAVYDFPEMMPSDEKIQIEVVTFASKNNGQVTVTALSQYLKKSMTETEMLLDGMVDGKRVVKADDGGITMYRFVELAGKKTTQKAKTETSGESSNEGGIYEKDQRVQVDSSGSWYDAKILVAKGNKYKIRYIGWDSSWDEWVGPDRIRKGKG